MKRFIKWICVALIAVGLSGCYKMNMNLIINDDGTAGNFEMEMLMSTELMETYEMTIEDLKQEMIGDLTVEELGQIKIETVNTKIDDVDYQGVKVTYADPTQSMVDVSDAVVVDTDNNTITFHMEGDDLASIAEDFNSEELGVDVSTLKGYGVEFNFNVIMPNKIETCVGGSVSESNPNMMSVDLLTFNGSVIEATCELKGSVLPINKNNMVKWIIGIGVVAVAAVLAYFIVSKRNQKDPY